MLPAGVLVVALGLVRAGPAAVDTASTATTSVRRPIHHGPAVAIFDTYSPTLVRGLLPVSSMQLRAFAAEMQSAAGEVFAWRRWTIVPDARLDAAVDELIEGTCEEDVCFARVGVEVGATHAVISSLVSPREGGCRATVTLYDLLKADLVMEIERPINPCSDDNLLSTASEIGRQIADGPRAPVQITLDLTPRTIPHLDLPDLGEVPRYIVSTSTRTDRVFELERALEIYKEQHMFVFDSDDGETYYVTRGGRLLSECDIRRVASAPRPDAISEFCDGNDWEWAWLGVPFGGLVMLGSSSDFLDGGFVGVIGMGIGGVMTIASAALALTLNVDKKDPRDGEYYSSRAEIETIVQQSNAQLRELLDLTDAEVAVAGMRL